MTDTPAIEPNAPLSVDDAVGLLDAVEAPLTIEAEPTAETEIDPDEPVIELDDEEAESENPDEPVILAPKSWAAEDRAVFATLPREAQQVIAAREAERDTTTQKAVQSAAEARKAADQELASVTGLKAATEQALANAAKTFQGKWDNVDWVRWAAEDPAAYTSGRAQFEAEQSELGRLATVAQAQLQADQRAFASKKMEDLKVLAPELLDPVKGEERVKELEAYLIKEIGVDPSILPTLDAKVIRLALKGMKYERLEAKAKSKATQPLPSARAVRPTAAAQTRTPQRAAEAARNRFSQTGSIDDAVAMLNAR